MWVPVVPRGVAWALAGDLRYHRGDPTGVLGIGFRRLGSLTRNPQVGQFLAFLIALEVWAISVLCPDWWAGLSNPKCPVRAERG